MVGLTITIKMVQMNCYESDGWVQHHFFASVDIHTHTHTHNQTYQKENKRHIFWLHGKNRCSIWFFIRFHFWNIDLCWKLVQIVIYLVTSVPFRSTCIQHIETLAIAIVREKRRRIEKWSTRLNPTTSVCFFCFHSVQV